MATSFTVVWLRGQQGMGSTQSLQQRQEALTTVREQPTGVLEGQRDNIVQGAQGGLELWRSGCLGGSHCWTPDPRSARQQEEMPVSLSVILVSPLAKPDWKPASRGQGVWSWAGKDGARRGQHIGSNHHTHLFCSSTVIAHIMYN